MGRRRIVFIRGGRGQRLSQTLGESISDPASYQDLHQIFGWVGLVGLLSALSDNAKARLTRSLPEGIAALDVFLKYGPLIYPLSSSPTPRLPLRR